MPKKTSRKKSTQKAKAARKPSRTAAKAAGKRKPASGKPTAAKPAKAKTSQGKRSQRTSVQSDDGTVRLQKLLASHGHGSRRACEQFILEGRVEVDGKVVDQLGSKVDPEKQKVTLDGERVIQQKLQYFMLNKPAGVVSTASDPTGRIRVIDLIQSKSRVYNVGRLDKSSEGLILVTNDGDLAHKLTHPRFGVEKRYHVTVVGVPDREKLAILRKGVYLAEAFVQVANVKVKKRMRDKTILEVVLDEGRNREIRRLLAKIGHKVTQLKRVAIGPLTLGELPSGTHRELLHSEIKLLRRSVESGGSKSAPLNRRRKAKTASLRTESGVRNQKSSRFSPAAKSKKKRASKKSSQQRSAKRRTR